MARRPRQPDPSYYRGPRHAWSPATMVTGGGEDRDIDREVEEIVRLLREQGPMGPTALRRGVEARFWGPGRFGRALRIAERRGRIERAGRRLYQAAG